MLLKILWLAIEDPNVLTPFHGFGDNPRFKVMAILIKTQLRLIHNYTAISM